MKMIFLKKLNFILLMMIASSSYSQWTQKGVDIDGSTANDLSGKALSTSADGLTIAIGATGSDGNGSNSGQVRVYEFISGAWIQKGLDIDGETASEFSGNSVSLSDNGNIVVIGASYNSDNGSYSGQVRVYEFISGVWVQKGLDLNGDAANDFFGTSVSINGSGDIIAIGASGNDFNGTSAGQVKIYQYSLGVWNQLGVNLVGGAAGIRFGRSVSLNNDGTILAVGAYDSDLNGNPSGKCLVFEYTLGSWIQIGVDIDGDVANDFFGASVDLNSTGNTVIIGAYKSNANGSISGQVRVYQNIAGSWIQKGTDISGESAGDFLGCSVSISSDGSKIAAGGYGNDGNGGESGHVRVYEFSSNDWIQVGADIDGEASLDYSGYAIDLNANGTMVSIGAYGNDGAANSAGQVRTYVFCTSSTGTDTQIACNSYTWIDGNTYTSTNNTATFNLIGVSVSGCDSLVALNLTIVNSTIGTDTRTECSPYTWIDGNTYSNNNSSATYILTSTNGCDSLVTLDLTIITVDVTLTVSGANLSSNENGATYQWLDCDNNNAIILGETNQTFTASSSGNYACEISSSCSVDTTQCANVTISGMIENGGELISIYPNPAANQLTVEIGSLQVLSISILDVTGKLINNYLIGAGETINTIDIAHLTCGVYFLQVQTENGFAVNKFVKE